MTYESNWRVRHELDIVEVFICDEVLRPSQPISVMSSPVSLRNHTFPG